MYTGAEPGGQRVAISPLPPSSLFFILLTFYMWPHKFSFLFFFIAPKQTFLGPPHMYKIFFVEHSWSCLFFSIFLGAWLGLGNTWIWIGGVYRMLLSFSWSAFFKVWILHAGVPIGARNILEDPELKNGVKSFRYHFSFFYFKLLCIAAY